MTSTPIAKCLHKVNETGKEKYKSLHFSKLHQIPLYISNEIQICVRALHDAEITLHFINESGKVISPGIRIVLGAYENTCSTVGFLEDKFPGALEQTLGVLTNLESQKFVIEWNRGRLRVLDSNRECLVWWQCSKNLLVSHYGIRTLGCDGLWYLEDRDMIITEANQYYDLIPVRSGRFEFETILNSDAYILLSTKAHFEGPNSGLVLGGWAETDLDDETSEKEWAKCWLEWDARSIKVGKNGKSEPLLAWQNNFFDQPILPQFQFVGLQSELGCRSKWNVIDSYPLEEYEEFAQSHFPKPINFPEPKTKNFELKSREISIVLLRGLYDLANLILV